MKKNIIEDAFASIPPEIDRYTANNLAIAEYVRFLLKQQELSQKDLAQKLGKTVSDVSRMLSGLQNLTLKTISKLEVALETDILHIPVPEFPRNMLNNKLFPTSESDFSNNLAVHFKNFTNKPTWGEENKKANPLKIA